VKVNEEVKLNIHATFNTGASGQLPFLGSIAGLPDDLALGVGQFFQQSRLIGVKGLCCTNPFTPPRQSQ
jgi:hypothetical protein